MPQLELANLSNLDIPLSKLQFTRVYEQSFENGTSDLTEHNCTQEVQDEEVFAGKYALKVTIPAGGTGYVETPTRPVSPGQLVTFSFVHKEGANITEVKLQVVWRRSSGGIISTDEFTLELSDTWTIVSRTISAPKNAVSMAIRVQATASDSGDGIIYLDDITMDLVGLVIRTDGAGNIMVSVQNFEEILGTELKTLTDIYNRLNERLPRVLYDSGGAELSEHIKNLDVKLSTRASEETLELIANRLYESSLNKTIAQLLADIRSKIILLVFDTNNFLKTTIANSEIMVPVDLQGTTIMVPVDIQGITVTLPVKIEDILKAYDSSRDALRSILQHTAIMLPVDLQGITIMLPVDLQGTTIMMPVDLQGATIGYDSAKDEFKVNAVPRRSTPVHELSSYTLSAGGVTEIVKSELDGYSSIAVTVKATYNSNATQGVRVRWMYSPDGTNYDTPEDAEAQGNYEDLMFEAGKTRQKTIRIPILQPYVKIQIINKDSGYPVVIDVWTTPMR